MSKAILVLPEMPESCLRCDFGYNQEYTSTVYCSRLEKSVECIDHRPDFCPLRPIPNRKKPFRYDSHDFGYAKGWNSCIETIEGSGVDADKERTD